MNTKQAFVTILIVIILLYVGFYGILHNQTSNENLHHYVIFILNIIPAASILIGLLFRILLGRSSTSKKFIISSISCTMATIGITLIYIFTYSQNQMLHIPGILIYCLIVNFLLLLCNSIITIMGLN